MDDVHPNEMSKSVIKSRSRPHIGWIFHANQKSSLPQTHPVNKSGWGNEDGTTQKGRKEEDDDKQQIGQKPTPISCCAATADLASL